MYLRQRICLHTSYINVCWFKQIFGTNLVFIPRSIRLLVQRSVTEMLECIRQVTQVEFLSAETTQTLKPYDWIMKKRRSKTFTGFPLTRL